MVLVYRVWGLVFRSASHKAVFGAVSSKFLNIRECEYLSINDSLSVRYSNTQIFGYSKN